MFSFPSLNIFYNLWTEWYWDQDSRFHLIELLSFSLGNCLLSGTSSHSSSCLGCLDSIFIFSAPPYWSCRELSLGWSSLWFDLNLPLGSWLEWSWDSPVLVVVHCLKAAVSYVLSISIVVYDKRSTQVVYDLSLNMDFSKGSVSPPMLERGSCHLFVLSKLWVYTLQLRTVF